MTVITLAVLLLPSPDRWPEIRCWWIWHADTEVLTRFFTFPANVLHQGMNQFYCSFIEMGAMGYTAATIKAFIGIGNDGGFTLLWIWDEDIHHTYLYACVASVTDVFVNHYRLIRSGQAWNPPHLFFIHLIYLLCYQFL